MAAATRSGLSIAKLFGVAGKRVLVTGGGRGIGEMIARTFVENGAHVYISSRSAEALEAKAKELNAIGEGSCTPIAADLSKEAGCLDLAEQLSAKVDSLHVLVNNSGTSWGEPLEKYRDMAWDRVFNLNVKGVFTTTRALLPLLDKASTAEDPARVINIGSVAGLQPQPVPTYAYDASKAAVHSLTRKLASEFCDRRADGGHRITVNAIAPGYVPSKMSQQLLTYVGREVIEQGIPMGRLGSPEDMGGAAVYLASRAGGWVTGHILTVDGGAIGAVPISMVGGDAAL